MNTLGEVLKNARKEKGLTQDQLGEEIGVSKHTIAKYEQNQREPSLDIITKLINFLDLDFWDLPIGDNLQLDPVPYKEGEEFGNKIYEQVNKDRHVENFLRNSSVEIIFHQLFYYSSSFGVKKGIRGVILEEEDRIKERLGEKYNPLDFHTIFEKFKFNFHKDLERAILNTIDIKLKNAKEDVKKYTSIILKDILGSYKDYDEYLELLIGYKDFQDVSGIRTKLTATINMIKRGMDTKLISDILGEEEEFVLRIRKILIKNKNIVK
ncbi:helix-turn-helix domain-containing protein [Clostridium hydrogeniformans]|uniref:helix-turn-helix domain-containing protein n=1 Tax=Clostridium hydrogeniformans TaxID=349933 RepID=UPI00054F389A|nr:helix-turn-helix transcriptional regulator [Clostridium hydrogeniformans]